LPWIALAVMAVACATPVPQRVDFSEARRTYRAKDYPQVLATWSRHAKLVRDIGIVIEAWALYKSWDYRQVYLEQYADIYDLSEADRAELNAAQLEAAFKTYEFHIAAQTTSFEWNDLEKDSSAWRVTLVDGIGAELPAGEIESPDLPQLYETQFFPNKTDFSRTYVVRFDRQAAEQQGFAGPGSDRIKLRIASPLGKIELVWQSK